MPIRFIHQSDGAVLGAGLAAAGGYMAGQQEAKQQQEEASRRERELQARLRVIDEQLRQSKEEGAARAEARQTAEAMNKFYIAGAQWDGPPSDANDALLREKFDQSLEQDPELSKLPGHAKPFVHGMARGAWQSEVLPQLTQDEREALLRSDPRDMQKMIALVDAKRMERQQQQQVAELDMRAQGMQAKGIPFDQVAYAKATDPNTRAAILDQAQQQYDDAISLEETRARLMEHFAPKKDEAGMDDPEALLSVRAKETNRLRRELESAKSEEELRTIVTQLKLLNNPDAALADTSKLYDQIDWVREENKSLRALLESQQKTSRANEAAMPKQGGSIYQGKGAGDIQGTPPMMAEQSKTQPQQSDTAIKTGPVDFASMPPEQQQSIAAGGDAALKAAEPTREARKKALLDYLKQNNLEPTPAVIEAIISYTAPEEPAKPLTGLKELHH